MSKDKSPKVSPVNIKDAKHYYRSIDNRRNIGFSFTYGVRNHTSKPIHIRTRGGYSQIIEPATNSAYSNHERELETPGVWLDVRFKTADLNRCHRASVNTPNTVDDAIDEYIRQQVAMEFRARENMGMDRSGPHEIIFSLGLKSIKPNYNNKAYYSETLGLIIDLESTGEIHEFLAEIPDTFSDCIDDDNNDSTRFEVKNALYLFSFLVDNTNEVGEIWCAHGGDAARLRGLRNPMFSSGIYIFNSETYHPDALYKYIPANEINETILAEHGMAYSRKEILNAACTKEHAELKKREEQHIKEIEKLKEEGRKQREENEKLKTQIKRLTEELNEEKLRIIDEQRKAAEEQQKAKHEYWKIKQKIERQEEERRDLEREIKINKRSNILSIFQTSASMLRTSLDILKMVPR